MPVLSAGLLLYRDRDDAVEVLIAHPGGPFWAHKDEGAWSIPKGEYPAGEDAWEAARREFAEELGSPVPAGRRLDLGPARQPGGKILTVFAVAADLDIDGAHSNTVTLEWPKGSGRIHRFPEIDRVAWLPLDQAYVKLLRGQRIFLDRLADKIG